MNYEEFLFRLSKELKTALEPDHGPLRIEISDIEKLSGKSYKGLMIGKNGSNMSMSLNLKAQFDQLTSGRPYVAILNEAISKVSRELSQMPQIDHTNLTSYEYVKTHLTLEIVGIRQNREMLQKLPYKRIEDMAVVYRCELGSHENGSMSTLITNEMLSHLGITPAQLHEDALRSAPQINPASLRPMIEILSEMTGSEMTVTSAEPPMYVATTAEKENGACVIAYPGFFEQAKELVGDQLFILPSSKHEVLILPDNGDFPTGYLMDMVCMINATQVAPEDRLTDNVYHYDGEDRVFETAKQYDERMTAKETELSHHAKGSVLRDLESRQAECRSKPPAPNMPRYDPVL